MEKREVYLHPAEEIAMEALGEAWNAICNAFGPSNENTISEAANHIHALQRMILANVTARAYPEKYRVDIR